MQVTIKRQRGIKKNNNLEWNSHPQTQNGRLLPGVRVCESKHYMNPGIQLKHLTSSSFNHQFFTVILTRHRGKQKRILWNSSSFGLDCLLPVTHSLCVIKISIRRGGEGGDRFQDRNLHPQILSRLLAPSSCCSSSFSMRCRSYHQVKKGLLLWKLCVYDSLFALWGALAVSTITGGIWTNWRGDLPSFRAWHRFRIWAGEKDV